MNSGVVKTRARVVALNRLSEFGYELLLERSGIEFKPGQLINLHGRNHLEDRSYTVCSGDRDEHLIVLFRHIPSGILTPQLVALAPSDHIAISGPYGEFIVRDPARKIFFFATGTGVAPCRAYARSHPGLDFTLVHGVRKVEDLFYRNEFSSGNYLPCISGERAPAGMFAGRVTEAARARAWPANGHYYLCGANEMIYEMQEILEAAGVPRTSIFTEAYYYRSDDA